MTKRATRRTFLKLSAAAASVTAAKLAHAAPGNVSVSLIVDPDDPLTKTPPVQWALDKLVEALGSRGIIDKLARARSCPL